jgi:hypothetical protein
MRSVYLRAIGAGWAAIFLSAASANAAGDLPCPVYDNHPPTASLNASGPIAISGDTVVVNGQVFVRSAQGWTNQAVFEEGEVFLDGNILVSLASVYVRTGNVWSLETVLPRVDTRYHPLAISGNTIAVPWSGSSGTVGILVRTGTSASGIGPPRAR